MPRLFNDPDDFLDELAEGFRRRFGPLGAGRSRRRGRSTRSPEPTVALVDGGGSGHYPASPGLVGSGRAYSAAADRSLREAWQNAATVANQAAQQTARLAAKLGRARSHGEKSIGTPDPDAVSFALVCTTVAQKMGQEPSSMATTEEVR